MDDYSGWQFSIFCLCYFSYLFYFEISGYKAILVVQEYLQFARIFHKNWFLPNFLMI